MGPVSQEDVDLAAEESRLGFADALRTAAEGARESLSGEDGAADALSTTSAARTLLDGVREHDAEAGELADRLAEITYLLSDVAADVASYASRLDTDPARLAAVSERRAALTALTRKYGDTIDDVLAWAQASAARLLDLDGTDERIEALRAERGAAGRRARRRGGGPVVRARRGGGPARRARSPTSSRCSPCRTPTFDIALTRTSVHRRPVSTTSSSCSPPTSGPARRPLHKGASGGELSRVMLALEVALAGTSPVPTFVFDEVDAGVGGAAAVEVGRRLAAAGPHRTGPGRHPPAAGGGLRRPARPGREVRRRLGHQLRPDASSTTRRRERELSRMLAGLTDSDTALAHARELLTVAREARSLTLG